MLERPTQQHLARARRNRDVADALVGPAAQGIINPPALEWAIVAAFYAAVHYVNAYLWEKLRAEPRDHRERTNMVARAHALRAAFKAYRNLQDLAFQARYARTFDISPVDAADAVHADLRAVERVVLAALSIPLN